MPEALFIDQNDLNDYVPANDTIDPFEVEAAILQAQDVHLKPLMGYDWFAEFQAELPTPTGANATVYPMIKKLLAYATAVVLRVNLLDRMTNTGITVLSTPWESSVQAAQFDRKTTQYGQSATQAAEDLRRYLAQNIDNYPLYKQKWTRENNIHPKGFFA